MTGLVESPLGRPLERVEGIDKISGRARYAYEHVARDAMYGWVVGSPVPSGRVTAVDVDGLLRADPQVVAVVWHGNAPTLGEADDGELAVLQSDEVSYRGQIVAVVVARTAESARAGADALVVTIEPSSAATELSVDDPAMYAPETVNAGFPTDTSAGDVDRALQDAAVTVDRWYTTPSLHNSPMEPHATIAVWESAERATLWDSTQAASEVASTTAALFGLDDGAVVVHSVHVGGGFGSKGSTRPQAVLALMAAKAANAPVKVTLTRQMMFDLVGYRTPTRSHIRLGAGTDGRLTAISHQAFSQTSKVQEFAEQTAEPTRHVYAAANRLMTHRLAALNVPTPRWMRAPGEAPGIFALESAMDELARALDIDPIELRARNEPDVDPDSGKAFSSRHYVDCLRTGAERFGWTQPYEKRVGRTLVGHGVAGAVYPAMRMPSTARAEVFSDGRFRIATAAADIGQGARTVLRQIAADALGVEIERVTVDLGDSSLPMASVAGGSSGTASWGTAVTNACRQLRGELGRRDGIPREGLNVEASNEDDINNEADLARFAYGAHFVEVHVDADTREVRVPRAVGVFAVGRVLNPRLARSQFIGAMTMGLGMALTEEGVWDPRSGATVNNDFASYHIPSNADVVDLDVSWLAEDDDQLNPMGSKGIGEIGNVGAAAAVCNAVFDATGIRVRDLPVTLDKLL